MKTYYITRHRWESVSTTKIASTDPICRFALSLLLAPGGIPATSVQNYDFATNPFITPSNNANTEICVSLIWSDLGLHECSQHDFQEKGWSWLVGSFPLITRPIDHYCWLTHRLLKHKWSSPPQSMYRCNNQWQTSQVSWRSLSLSSVVRYWM